MENPEQQGEVVETVSGLEPDCQDTPGGYQRSAAISLKRIADAFDQKDQGPKAASKSSGGWEAEF